MAQLRALVLRYEAGFAAGFALTKMAGFTGLTGLAGTVAFAAARAASKAAFAAAFCSGVVAAFSITPAEQLVIDKQSGVKIYNLKHLYKGIVPTIARESIGFAIHFTVYDPLV